MALGVKEDAEENWRYDRRRSRIERRPGSIVVVRDGTWIVVNAETTTSGLLIRVEGLSELVRDSTASSYRDTDTIIPLDPEQATVKGDDSSGYRKAMLCLEATLGKSPVPLNAPELTVSARADSLGQQTAVREALDPENLRPRIVIADAVHLGKTFEIGMILSELVRRGRGERTHIVTPRHVLEQTQHEMWTWFAVPFVRLDSVWTQRVSEANGTTHSSLPVTRTRLRSCCLPRFLKCSIPKLDSNLRMEFPLTSQGRNNESPLLNNLGASDVEALKSAGWTVLEASRDAVHGALKIGK